MENNYETILKTFENSILNSSSSVIIENYTLFKETLHSITDISVIYYLFNNLFEFLTKIFSSVSKKNKESYKIFYTQKKIIKLIKILLNAKIIELPPFSLNISLYIEQLPEGNLKNFFTIFTEKLNQTNNLELIETLNENKTFNIPKYDPKVKYDITDLILAYIVYFMNINDFAKENLPPKTNNDKLVHNNYLSFIINNLFETNCFENALENQKNFNLLLLVLIKCKHIIFHNDIQYCYDHHPLNYKLLFYNFLANFEKQILKQCSKYNIIGVDFNNTIEQLVLTKNNKHQKYFYNFGYFTDIYNCIIKDLEITEIEKNEEILKNFENIKKEIKEKLKLDEIVIINEKLIAKKLYCKLFFIKFADFLLQNNKKYHKFTFKYFNNFCLNKQIPANMQLDNFYNMNYISFKKPYKFVKDFNNLVYYHNIIFNNITPKDIVSFFKPNKIYNEMRNKIITVIPSSVSESKVNDKVIRYFFEHDVVSLFIRNLVNDEKYNYYQQNPGIRILLNTTDEPLTFNKNPKYKVNNADSLKKINEELDKYVKKLKIDMNILIEKMFDEYFEKFIISLTELKNIYFTMIPSYDEAGHSTHININFDEQYIDIYNPWCEERNIYDFNNLNPENHKDCMTELKTTIFCDCIKNYFISLDISNKSKFEEKLLPLINEKFKKDIHYEIFKINHYYLSSHTQGEFENQSSGFCVILNTLYSFIRLFYFNNKEYSMNYIQQMINEYIISFNHPIYFYCVICFLLMVRICIIKPNFLIKFENFNHKIAKLLTSFSPLDKKNFNELSNFFQQYRTFLMQLKVANIHNSVFERIFKKSIENNTNLHLFNTDINTNINISNINLNYPLFTHNEQMKTIEKLIENERIKEEKKRKEIIKKKK
jgi:hypothetical protein